MKSFCILGMNRFGQAIAMTLAQEKKQVMIMDDSKEAVSQLADYVTAAVVGDPKNEQALRAAGIADYDCCIVCNSGKIEDSILITLLLKDIGAKYVLARAQSELHMRILKKVGADKVVYPERDMGERLAQLLSKNNVTNYLEVSEDISLVEVKAPEKWVGKSLAELAIRSKYNVNIIAVTYDNTHDFSPNPTEPIKEGSVLTIVGNKKNVDRLL